MNKRFFITCFILICVFSNMDVYGTNSKIPILMYHDITPLSQSDNQWAVTQQSFYDDMVYLKQNNYTTLLPTDMIAIKNGESVMPQKPIMITFDDGYTSNYQYALPILEALNMNATVAVITGLMRTNKYEGNPSYLTWQQITSMYESGRVNIGSHTNNLHRTQDVAVHNKGGIKGIGRLQGESKADYSKRTAEDLQTSINLIKTYTKNSPCYFAYPYGKTDSWFLNNLEGNGIKMSTTVSYKVANIKKGLMLLPRLTVTPKESASYVLTKKNQKAIITANVITEKLTVNQKEVSFQVFSIADNSYISISDLQKQCWNSESQFSVLIDDHKEVNIIMDYVEGEVSEADYLEKIITVNYADKIMDTPPILISVGTKYAVAFYIDGDYFIRLNDVKKLILK